MRSKNPELMEKICNYAEQHYLQNGHSPSTSMIAEAPDTPKATVYRYQVEMDEKGMMEYDGQEIQTTVTKKMNKDTTQTTRVGCVPCGSPQYEEENIREYISLPTASSARGYFFILRASGNSMIDAGIDDGDLVVVRKQNTANEGVLSLPL